MTRHWPSCKRSRRKIRKVQFTEIFNTVDYTKAQYHSAMDGLIEGAVLAVLVVLLFLRDIRATLISALAIPLSAIPAFWFMNLLGITLNFMSTMAMSLVAGVLVDDAIVEIENIVRHMRMGKSAYQASIDAADEIGLAVLATTMAIVAVFLPVALMPGISGQFFKAFGFTVVVSVMMSLLVARMVTPLVAAYFLRSHGEQPHAAWKWMDIYLGVLKWSLNTAKAHAYRLRHPGFFGKLKSVIYDHRLYMVGAGLGTLVAQWRSVWDPVDDVPAAAESRLFDGQHHASARLDASADRSGGRSRRQKSCAPTRMSQRSMSGSTSPADA